VICAELDKSGLLVCKDANDLLSTGAGLTPAKVKECRWIKPVLVGHFEFTEWTPEDHLRHSKFVALREDKKALDVKRE
jgi:ATP-dependent DNA ligase